jgi:hypothetical protein
MLGLGCDIDKARPLKNKYLQLGYHKLSQVLHLFRDNPFSLLKTKSRHQALQLWTDEFLISNEDNAEEFISSKGFQPCFVDLCLRYLDLGINLVEKKILIKAKDRRHEILHHPNFVYDGDLDSVSPSLIYDLAEANKIPIDSELMSKFHSAPMIQLLINKGVDPNYNDGELATLIESKDEYWALRDCGIFNMRARDDILLERVPRIYILRELIEVYGLDPRKYAERLIRIGLNERNGSFLRLLMNYEGMLDRLPNDLVRHVNNYVLRVDYDNKSKYPESFKSLEKGWYDINFDCLIDSFVSCFFGWFSYLLYVLLQWFE